MKNIIALLIIIFAIAINDAKAQITLQCVKPGNEVLVKPENDTLWIMNDIRMRRVIETGRKYTLEQEKTKLLTQKCDTLQTIVNEKDSLINLLKTDRDYYVTELSTCRDNVDKVGAIANKYRRQARLGRITTVVGFCLGVGVGYFLFK